LAPSRSHARQRIGLAARRRLSHSLPARVSGSQACCQRSRWRRPSCKAPPPGWQSAAGISIFAISQGRLTERARFTTDLSKSCSAIPARRPSWPTSRPGSYANSARGLAARRVCASDQLAQDRSGPATSDCAGWNEPGRERPNLTRPDRACPRSAPLGHPSHHPKLPENGRLVRRPIWLGRVPWRRLPGGPAGFLSSQHKCSFGRR
jgi:hypothetical protein